MRSDFAAAAKFYEQVAQSAAKPATGMEPRPAAGAPSFADFLKEAGGEVVSTLKQGEAQSIKGLAGKAELADVVSAVSQAEVALQTVVAVRDKVIAAYQDIMRMPI
jgi:flagellar hook-basal body complex protein FliE